MCETIQFYKKPIRQLQDKGFLSANDIIACFNNKKRLCSFMCLQTIKLFLSDKHSILAKKGKHGGTWISEELAELLYRWCAGENISRTFRYEHKMHLLLTDIFGEIFTIIPQYKIKNYRVDWYIKELNMCLEYDEAHHKSKMKEDKQREKEIMKSKNCTFLRIPQGEEIQVVKVIMKFALGKYL